MRKEQKAVHTDGRSCFIVLSRCEERQDNDCMRLGFLNVEAPSFGYSSPYVNNIYSVMKMLSRNAIVVV